MNRNEIKYNSNFISQVIFRIDFQNFISSDQLSTLENEIKISTNYQFKKMDQVIKFNSVSIMNNKNDSRSQVNSETVDGVQKTYLDAYGNKLILSNKFFVIECNKYSGYSVFKNSFIRFLERLFSIANIKTERVGLRYINLFDTKNIKLQKGFFNRSIASEIQKEFYSDELTSKLIRSIHTIEFAIGELKLNFRYGLFNPNYPSPIISDDFILDYDCFINSSAVTFNDISNYLDQSHSFIQEIFESSITNKFRDYLNKIE